MAFTRIVQLRAAAVVVDQQLRCWRCRLLVMESAARPWAFTCPRCRAKNASEPEGIDTMR